MSIKKYENEIVIQLNKKETILEFLTRNFKGITTVSIIIGSLVLGNTSIYNIPIKQNKNETNHNQHIQKNRY